jgi:hypothetical protein
MTRRLLSPLLFVKRLWNQAGSSEKNTDDGTAQNEWINSAVYAFIIKT